TVGGERGTVRAAERHGRAFDAFGFGPHAIQRAGRDARHDHRAVGTPHRSLGERNAGPDHLGLHRTRTLRSAGMPRLRVIAQFGAASPQADVLRQAHPDVELVEFTAGDPPAGLQAEAFFGGYLGWDDILRWLDAAGVQWVQLSGTGVDKVPPVVFAGRT